MLKRAQRPLDRRRALVRLLKSLLPAMVFAAPWWLPLASCPKFPGPCPSGALLPARSATATVVLGKTAEGAARR
eukprot:911631-Pyramimonas_sp.AAC.1